MTIVPASIRNRNPASGQLTVERAREMFLYDPDTGILRWTRRLGPKVRKDLIAGYVDSEGYRVVRLDGVNMRAHRIIWLLVHGVLPADMIDHVNGARSDNRLANLREATNAQNQMNKTARKSSAARLKGVAIVRKACGLRYRPQIYIDGKLKTFGLCKTAAEAHDIYKVKAAQMFGEYARFE